MLLMVEDAGTRNVVRSPIITGPKSKAAARSLVMPMNVTSILPPLNASIMSAGLRIDTNSCGTPSRRASSMPMSGLQPSICPFCSTAKYDSISTPTRSLPLGANWRAVSAALCALPLAARPSTAAAAISMATVDDRMLMSTSRHFTASLERELYNLIAKSVSGLANCASAGARPQFPGRQPRTFAQRLQLRPGDLRMDPVAHAAVGARNDVLLAHRLREQLDPPRHQLRMFDRVGRVADHTRYQHRVVRQLHVAPGLPFVLMTRVRRLKQQPARPDLE